jgi:potassium channel subfamily K
VFRVTIVNAISLSVAIIANLALLLNMGGYLRFIIAQPIVILGWYLSSFILIVLVAVVASTIQSPHGHIFSQAFYYAIFAAGLYFIISSLMVVSLYGAYFGHYTQDFKASMEQMPLMAQTISFAVYLLGGAAIFMRIEGWRFLDAVYWADYTILTVGIGDFAPKTHLGRSLLFPYAVGGVIILGLIVASIQSFTSDRGTKKLSIMTRKKYLMSMKRNASASTDPRNPSFTEGGNRMALKTNSKWAISKAEFSMMRSIQGKVAHRRQWNLFLSSVVTWFLLWLVSAEVFRRAERAQNWSYFKALYFTYTSLMTIGYGDVYPTSNFGKAFFVFWSLLAVPTLTVLISSMGSTVLKVIKEVVVWIGEVALKLGERGLGGDPRQISSELRNGTRSKHHEASASLKGKPTTSKGKGTQGSPTEKLAEDQSQENWKDRIGEEKIGGQLGQNTQYYHYLLVEEIANVVNDLKLSRERQYTYEEWTWFIALISAGDETGVFDGLSPSKSEELEFGGQGLGAARKDGEDDESRQWGWYGSQSPFMGEKTEPEWVLECLSSMLKRGLKEELNKQEQEPSNGNSTLRRRAVPNGGGGGLIEAAEA